MNEADKLLTRTEFFVVKVSASEQMMTALLVFSIVSAIGSPPSE